MQNIDIVLYINNKKNKYLQFIKKLKLRTINLQLKLNLPKYTFNNHKTLFNNNRLKDLFKNHPKQLSHPNSNNFN